MNPADEAAVKMAPTERPSAGAAAGSIDKLDRQLRVSVDALRHLSPPPIPELDDLLSAINHHLDGEASERKAIRHRLLAIENEMERVASGGFVRYLVATCIAVAVILAAQFYGEATKRMIASSVQQLGWSTKPPPGPQSTAVQRSVPETQVATLAQTVPAAVTPATPSIDPMQVQQIIQSLAALREGVQQLSAGQKSLAPLAQTVDQLATSQDQMVHQIDMLQSANQEILAKIPAPPPPPPRTNIRHGSWHPRLSGAAERLAHKR